MFDRLIIESPATREAIKRGVDPTPVDVILKLKRELAPIIGRYLPATPGARTPRTHKVRASTRGRRADDTHNP